ncbi:MAG: hypothetical protein U5M23_15255 [Marinagarivorans sp.]|nr:hypothetical protein [Marinagarivorans sp.]
MRPFQIAVNPLLLRPPKAPFLQQAKTLKAKDLVERSASFFDRRHNRVHIVRVRWVKMFYLETAPWYLRIVVAVYADHEVKDAASGKTYLVKAEDAVGGYIDERGYVGHELHERQAGLRHPRDLETKRRP